MMSNQNCSKVYNKFSDRKNTKAHETITWNAVENEW